jgi:hypothetical protein
MYSRIHACADPLRVDFTAGSPFRLGPALALAAKNCGSVMPIADRPPAWRIVRRDNGVDADSIDRLKRSLSVI